MYRPIIALPVQFRPILHLPVKPTHRPASHARVPVIEVDTSPTGERVTRVLDRLARIRGAAGMHRLRQWAGVRRTGTRSAGARARRHAALYRAGKTGAERVCREPRWQTPRRMSVTKAGSQAWSLPESPSTTGGGTTTRLGRIAASPDAHRWNLPKHRKQVQLQIHPNSRHNDRYSYGAHVSPSDHSTSCVSQLSQTGPVVVCRLGGDSDRLISISYQKKFAGVQRTIRMGTMAPSQCCNR
jgi:hypothetical protein